MSESPVLVERENGIALITINRPEALNAMNRAAGAALAETLDQIAVDDSVRVVIITGGGPKSFVAGAAIDEMADCDIGGGRAYGAFGCDIYGKIEAMPKPVIAAVNGFALGGGCELALACDFIVASEKAKFGQPEVNLGIIPGWGGTQRLPRAVGPAKAKELIYSGDMIDAAEAYRIGLVNYVKASVELLPFCRELAAKIASRAPLAVAAAKTAITRGLNMDLASGLALETELFGGCFATADQKEGMRAFLAKEKAAFQGR